MLYSGFAFSYIVEKIMDFYDATFELDSYGIPANFPEIKEKIDFYSKIFVVGLEFSIFLGLTSPLLEYDNCIAKNNEYFTCGVANTWAPFNITVFPYREIVYVVNAYTQYSFYSEVCSLNIFAACFSIYLTFRLEYAVVLFKRVNSERNSINKRYLLFEAIEYHQKITR